MPRRQTEGESKSGTISTMHALEVLEFAEVLELLAGHCETPMGRERACAQRPRMTLDGVEGLWAETLESRTLSEQGGPPSLAAVQDFGELVTLASKGACLGGKDIFQIAQGLQAMRTFREFVEKSESLLPLMTQLALAFPSAQAIERQVFQSLEPSGEVRDSASPELARLRRRLASHQGKVLERVQSYVSGKTRALLSDPLYTQRDGRYVIPLKAEHKGKIRGIVHGSSASGQTVFVEPEDVLQLTNAIRQIEGEIEEEVQRVLTQLSAALGSVAPETLGGIESAARFDLLLAKVRLSNSWAGSAPDLIGDQHGISLRRARHPLLDPAIVVPLDVEVGFERNGLLITGPNTGGKTVAIKTIGLCALLAQCGIPPPADAVRLGPFTQFWCDIGDEQSIQQSLSTFSGHIKNIAAAIKGLLPGALVLLDELGAGTDPAEGAALARAVLLRLKAGKAIVVASTHFGELKAFAYNTEGFENAAMEFDAKSLKPTYHLIMGSPGASHALKIAERYGLPPDVIEVATDGLSPEHQDLALMMESLEVAEKRARTAQSEADRRLSELQKAQTQAEKKLAEAAEAKKKAREELSREFESAMRDIRLEAMRIFEELAKSPRDASSVDHARKEFKALQEVAAERAEEFEVPEAPADAKAPLAKGAPVRIEGYAGVGTLLSDPQGDTVQVQMGSLRLKVKVGQVRVVESAPPAAKPRKSLGLNRAMNLRPEIHLRAKRAEDALSELEKFLDEAVLASFDTVRVVHGKGEGILRRLTHDLLRKHKHVRSFGFAEDTEGGQGVTVVVLK